MKLTRLGNRVSNWFRKYFILIMIVAGAAATLRFAGSPVHEAANVGRLLEGKRYEEAYKFIDGLQYPAHNPQLMSVTYKSPGFSKYLAKRWAYGKREDLANWGYPILYASILKKEIERSLLERIVASNPDDPSAMTVARYLKETEALGPQPK